MDAESIFSYAAFTKGSNMFIIGITAARYSTILHMLTTMKQQFRVTNATLPLRPRESTGSNGAKASDSTYNTTNVECQFFHELDSVGDRLGSYHTEGEERFENFVARTVGDFVVQLEHLLTRCLHKRLGLGHDREHRGWIFQSCVYCHRSNNKFVCQPPLCR